jgi:hypothetical protein
MLARLAAFLFELGSLCDKIVPKRNEFHARSRP